MEYANAFRKKQNKNILVVLDRKRIILPLGTTKSRQNIGKNDIQIELQSMVASVITFVEWNTEVERVAQKKIPGFCNKSPSLHCILLTAGM